MRLVTPVAARSSWPTAPARSLFSREQRPVRPDDGVVTAFRDGQVTLRSNRRQEGFTNAIEEIGYQGVRSGDLVIHSMDGFAGAIGVSESDGKASPVVHCYRPSSSVDGRYYAYLLRDLAVHGYITSLAKGIRERSTAFDMETFRSLVLPVPPRSIQRAIADYLDTETARIDALIDKKQRMIDLVKEWLGLYVRSAITGHGRSDAADNSPKSGHLGALPYGWQWIRARFLCDIDTGSSDTDESSEDGPYPFFVRSQTPQGSHRFIFDGEAVLTAGDGAGVGKVFHHFVGRFDAHQRVYVMHEFRRVTGRFYFYALGTFFAESALDGSAKSTVDSVRRHMLTEMQVPVPPLEEQKQIVHYLDDQTERINSIVAKLITQIDLLRERRQALITAAVTGELEIPGVAA